MSRKYTRYIVGTPDGEGVVTGATTAELAERYETGGITIGGFDTQSGAMVDMRDSAMVEVELNDLVGPESLRWYPIEMVEDIREEERELPPTVVEIYQLIGQRTLPDDVNYAQFMEGRPEGEYAVINKEQGGIVNGAKIRVDRDGHANFIRGE